MNKTMQKCELEGGEKYFQIIENVFSISSFRDKIYFSEFNL